MADDPFRDLIAELDRIETETDRKGIDQERLLNRQAVLALQALAGLARDECGRSYPFLEDLQRRLWLDEQRKAFNGARPGIPIQEANWRALLIAAEDLIVPWGAPTAEISRVRGDISEWSGVPRSRLKEWNKPDQRRTNIMPGTFGMQFLIDRATASIQQAHTELRHNSIEQTCREIIQQQRAKRTEG